MAKPTPKERIDHILNSIAMIHIMMDHCTLLEFETDIKLQSAIQWHFLLIGEAIAHVDGNMLSKYPYKWHIPKSFRNFIVHEYHRIKLSRIYQATLELDELQDKLELILESEFKE